MTSWPNDRLLGVRNDAELGWVRTCSDCGEEWPLDPDFYSVAKHRVDGSPVFHRRCLACSIADWRARRRTA